MSGHAPPTVVAATLGTERRDAPWPDALPAARRPEADATTTLLDALAVGAALGRAGRTALPAPAASAAPPDSRPEAPARAAAVLDLHLSQPAAGDATDEVLMHWLTVCGARGRRVPARLLPAVLDRATRAPGLRAAATAAIGERGAWLAGLNPVWRWPAEPDPAAWSTLGRADRLTVLRRLRRADPARAAALVAETMTAASAEERLDHLETLRVGLGPADEPLLEAALDDRAQKVRDRAQNLLDGLPGSRRGQRMAARLRPLLATRGLLRKTLTVTLPDDPDEAGIRDGLGDAPPRSSRRDWWLHRMAAAAPLSVWTEGGASPAVVARDLPAPARDGMVRTVLARGDAVWAEALFDPAQGSSLLAAMDPATAERHGLDWVRGRTTSRVPLLPLTPWSPRLSQEVAARLRREPAVADQLGGLVSRMDPAVLATLTDWLQTSPPSRGTRFVRDRIQLLSALRTIDEAFA